MELPVKCDCLHSYLTVCLDWIVTPPQKMWLRSLVSLLCEIRWWLVAIKSEKLHMLSAIALVPRGMFCPMRERGNISLYLSVWWLTSPYIALDVSIRHFWGWKPSESGFRHKRNFCNKLHARLVPYVCPLSRQYHVPLSAIHVITFHVQTVAFADTVQTFIFRIKRQNCK